MNTKHGPKDRPSSGKDFRAYYAYFIERGLCPRCSEHRPLIEGKRYCAECLERNRENGKRCKAAMRQTHRCYSCCKPLPEGYPYRHCEECRKRNREKYGEKYALRKSQTRYYRILNQRCTKCGRALEDRDRREDGRFLHMCFNCRVHAAELYHRRKAAEQS